MLRLSMYELPLVTVTQKKRDGHYVVHQVYPSHDVTLEVNGSGSKYFAALEKKQLSPRESSRLVSFILDENFRMFGENWRN